MFNSGLMGEFSLSVPLQCGRIGRQHLLRSPEGYGRRGVDLRAGPQRPGGTVRRPFAQRWRHADRNVGRGPAVMPTPERPAYLVEWNVGGSAIRKTNAIAPPGALFAFGLDTAAGRAPQSDAGIARYYAGMDIVGLQTGSLVTSIDGNQYRAARPAWIQAGRDIVNLKGLILNQRPNDVSRIAAGRDILYANVDIAGPGWLEIIAGRNLTQEDRGRLGSVGLIDGKPATGKAAPASSSASAARATTPPSPGAISTRQSRRPRPDPGQPARQGHQDLRARTGRLAARVPRLRRPGRPGARLLRRAAAGAAAHLPAPGLLRRADPGRARVQRRGGAAPRQLRARPAGHRLAVPRSRRAGPPDPLPGRHHPVRRLRHPDAVRRSDPPRWRRAAR